MRRVAALATLFALTLACIPPEGERYEDGCDYANDVYDDLYAAGAQDAADGVSILDASWQSIDCTAGPSGEWIEGCNTCALEAWSAGWQSVTPGPE